MARDEHATRAGKPRDVGRTTSAKRIVAEVPEGVHRQVRMRCFERGILIRDYILELLAKDGIS